MCRNIKRLRQPDRAPTDHEVADVAAAGRRLFDALRPGARGDAAA